MFNKNKFKAKVIEAGLTIDELAKEMKINTTTLYRKINGETEFTRSEIQFLRTRLRLDLATADSIFFEEKLA